MKNAPAQILRFGSFEFTKTGVRQYDFSDPYRIALTLNWRQFFLALSLVELCINVTYALLYMARPGCIANARPGSFFDAFFFSLETLATVGYGVMAPATLYGHFVSGAEILTGLGFTAVVTGLIFVRFSRPVPKVLFADQAVIALREGKPCLMIRIGNGNTTPMGNATAHLTAVMLQTTGTGHSSRILHDLKLERSHLPFFPLTWTLMHVIDTDSPLYGHTPETLLATDMRIVLTIEAYDYGVSANLTTMVNYSHAQILHNTRYQDAITIDDQGRANADLTRLSLVEADT